MAVLETSKTVLAPGAWETENEEHLANEQKGEITVIKLLDQGFAF